MSDDLLQQHGGKLVATALATIVGTAVATGRWLVGREFRRFDAFTEDHEKRLRTLEGTVATKGDIAELYERVNQIGDQMNAQHTTILNRLLDRS